MFILKTFVELILQVGDAWWAAVGWLVVACIWPRTVQFVLRLELKQCTHFHKFNLNAGTRKYMVQWRLPVGWESEVYSKILGCLLIHLIHILLFLYIVEYVLSRVNVTAEEGQYQYKTVTVSISSEVGFINCGRNLLFYVGMTPPQRCNTYLCCDTVNHTGCPKKRTFWITGNSESAFFWD